MSVARTAAVVAALPLLLAAAHPPAPLDEPTLPLTTISRPPVTLGAASSDDPAAELDACVAAEMADDDTPGAAVAVLLDGEEVYARGFGVVRRGSTTAVTPDTIFRIGSITKMLTTAAVLQQVERGRVSLDDPVRRFVPDLEMAGPWPEVRITVRHLLTHTSEIPDRFPGDDVDGPTTTAALSEWAASLGDTRLNAPPGSFFNYSNPNFALAGLIAERADGRDYHTLMRDAVFRPAGMTRTTLLAEDVLAWGDYSWGHDGPFTYAPDAYDNWAAAPAGYVFSTVRDLDRWAALLMDGGDGVLTSASTTAMQAPQVSESYTPDAFYGFGVVTIRYKDLDVHYHDGSIPGWGAFLLWVPERHFAVAVLANTSVPLGASALCAVDAYLEPPDVAPPDLTTDPATWTRYDGRYQLTTYLGEPLTVDVVADGGQLWFTFPGVSAPHHPGQAYRTAGRQLYPDTFLVDLNGDGAPETDVTFLDRTYSGARAMWFRNRYLVGPRTAHQGEVPSALVASTRAPSANDRRSR